MAIPTLYLITGMVGAGKTTLARKLAAEAGAVRLCPDEWIKAMLADPFDRTEADRLRGPVENLQWEMARELLAAGTSVILENGFWRRRERLECCRQVAEMDVEVTLHFINVPLDTLIARIRDRQGRADGESFHVTEEELERWLAEYEAPQHDEILVYDYFVEHTH